MLGLRFVGYFCLVILQDGDEGPSSKRCQLRSCQPSSTRLQFHFDSITLFILASSFVSGIGVLT